MELYKNLRETAKGVQIQIKKYYDRKRSKGLALKEGDKVWYKVKWIGYEETTQELEENLKNAEKKVKEYYKKIGQVKERKKG